MSASASDHILAKRLSQYRSEIHIAQLIRDRPNEVIAKCTGNGEASPSLVVHFLRNTPQNIRMHIEFETTQLKSTKCSWLPQVRDVVLDDEYLLLVTDFVPGISLDKLLATGPIPPEPALELAIGLFSCLRELHEIGVEHLDICPKNLIVSPGNLATLIRSSYLPTPYRSISMESAYCLSPEQAGAIERDVNATSDLYSAGVLLFQILTSTVPFQGNSIGDVLLAHMTQPVPSPCVLKPIIPKAISKVVERLLQKDPTKRYQTAASVVHDLTLILEAMQSGDSDPTISLGSTDRRASIVEPIWVGRNAELERFHQVLRDASDGHNSLIFLEGISGSGKSRTLSEFSRHAVENGWQIFRGQCIQEKSRKSMAAMEGVVKGFSELVHDAKFAESFTDQFDGEWSDLRSYFPDIRLPVGQDEGSSAGPISEQRSLRTLSYFLNALGSSERPALVILDDCQWADELALKMLKHWWSNSGQVNQHVTVIVCFRSDEVTEEDLLRRLGPSCHFQLGELRDADIRGIAVSMAGQLPPRVLDLVVAVSGGSPFMASAVVRGLVESKAIVQRDGVWEICEEEFTACQSSSQAGEFLSKRLELMPEEDLELLSAAAAIGREFNLDIASFLVSSDTTAAIRIISRARGRNLLWYRQSGNLYVFSHDKIRNALLQRIPNHQLRSWHHRAAEYLRSLDAPDDADIAYHYHAAGALELALPYALRAAQQASSICSFGIAKTQFRIAHLASKYASEEEKYAIETGLGRVLMQRGEYEEVEPHFRCAADHARSDLENAQALGNLAEIQRRKGNIGDAAKTYEKSLGILGFRVPKTILGVLFSLCRESLIQCLHTLFPTYFLGRRGRLPNDRERLALELFSGLSHSYYNGGSGPTVFFTHLYSLNLAERFLPSQQLAMLYLEHLGGVSMLGMRKRVEKYAERSREIQKDVFAPLRDGLTAHYLSVSYFCLGVYDLAIEHGYEAIHQLERVGDYWKIHMTRYQVAAALYHKGHLREAIEECRKNYESGIEKGDYQASGIILDVWARARPGDVPDEILQAEFERQRDDAQGTCQLLVAKTANLIGQGKLDEAIAAADRGIRLLVKTGLMNPYPFAIFVWACVALRKKAESLTPFESQQRRQLLRKALWYVRAFQIHGLLQPVDKPRLLRELALLQMMRGRSRRARRLLLRSIKVAQRQNAAYDEAESQRWLGELGSGHNWPSSKQHLDDGLRKLNHLHLEHGTVVVSRDAEQTVTVSLADRFDTILDVGRRIASALSDTEVNRQTRQAAIRLLRSEECVLVGVERGALTIVDGPEIDLDAEIVRHAIIQNQTVVTTSENGNSVICSPISVLGETRVCLYASHSMIEDLFGPTEKKLADFIAALAGASLENAIGYRQLQELNATLEDRVAERTQAAELRARELAKSNLELERTADDLRHTEEQLRDAAAKANAASESEVTVPRHNQPRNSHSHEWHFGYDRIGAGNRLERHPGQIPERRSTIRSNAFDAVERDSRSLED